MITKDEVKKLKESAAQALKLEVALDVTIRDAVAKGESRAQVRVPSDLVGITLRAKYVSGGWAENDVKVVDVGPDRLANSYEDWVVEVRL